MQAGAHAGGGQAGMHGAGQHFGILMLNSLDNFDKLYGMIRDCLRNEDGLDKRGLFITDGESS